MVVFFSIDYPGRDVAPPPPMIPPRPNLESSPPAAVFAYGVCWRGVCAFYLALTSSNMLWLAKGSLKVRLNP